jgi:serine/threonine-protein kinase HipA
LERELSVLLEVSGANVHVGTLRARTLGPTQSASFAYTREWLSTRGAFSFDPELPLAGGTFHTAKALFNVFTAGSPGRWAQNLLRHQERVQARREGRAPRPLLAADLLLLVPDEARLGALRLVEGGPATALPAVPGRRLPALAALPRVLAASERVSGGKDGEADLRLLVRAGTALGGAHPKATLRGLDGSLLLAKFAALEDDWPVARWEAVALELAAAAGVHVPRWRLQLVRRRPVLVVWRFDRQGGRRLPFMSGLTAVGASDDGARGYADLVDALRREGSQVAADLEQLWRRLLFAVLVSSTGDGLRKHGLLRVKGGWRLSPAFGLSPVPSDVHPRVHALALTEGVHDASLEVALAAAPTFGLSSRAARAIVGQVAAAVRRWREVGKRLGAGGRELDRMESAFEHADLEAATR